MISYFKKLIQYFCRECKIRTTKPRQKEASEQYVNSEFKNTSYNQKLQRRSHTLQMLIFLRNFQ